MSLSKRIDAKSAKATAPNKVPAKRAHIVSTIQFPEGTCLEVAESSSGKNVGLMVPFTIEGDVFFYEDGRYFKGNLKGGQAWCSVDVRTVSQVEPDEQQRRAWQAAFDAARESE